MKNSIGVILATLVSAPSIFFAQEPGTIPWTRIDKGDLVRTAIVVPPQYGSVGLNPTTHQVSIPRGWTANVYFAGAGLDKGRFMSWGPDSVLFVANVNKSNILALPDKNRDGIADTSIIAARGFSNGHDVRFWHDTMFVSQESGVVKLWRSDTNTYVFDRRLTVIDKGSQANQTGGNHRTLTLVIDTLRMKFYVNVGSRGNADREPDRAVIEEYNLDGSGRRQFATGTRNAVGMTLHPRTGKLWANNNGSDNQGNDVPPEWVDIVRDGGFYGYPFAYHFRRWYSFVGDYADLLPISKTDSSSVESMVPPAALVAAHCAPMALVFTENATRPEHQYGAFMAMRGSWNRNPPSGAKVVFMSFDNDQDTIANSVKDFCTGFIIDTNDVNSRWARPVGLAVAADGSVYVTSDEIKQFILKLTPPTTTSVDEGNGPGCIVYPNPTSDEVTCTVPSVGILVSVYDASGALVDRIRSVSTIIRFSTSVWAAGAYQVKIGEGVGAITRTILVVR
ncbi:MAG: PQQ-dependent sugar dehydrogenase [Candidatus Kapabacteria bacterium]|nr:PQQ-dependent sugar dehydrogenase [Candidatus Kapabacteria bacterium]